MDALTGDTVDTFDGDTVDAFGGDNGADFAADPVMVLLGELRVADLDVGLTGDLVASPLAVVFTGAGLVAAEGVDLDGDGGGAFNLVGGADLVGDGGGASTFVVGADLVGDGGGAVDLVVEVDLELSFVSLALAWFAA